MENPICRICGSALDCDFVTIGSLGQISLRHSSELRGDGLFTTEEDNLILHVKCRKKYTNERCAQAAYKRKINLGRISVSNKKPAAQKLTADSLLPLPSSQLRTKIISESVPDEEFDCQLHCFFCKKDAGSAEFLLREKKKPQNKRNIVSSVTESSTKEKILCASYDQNDEWSKEVRERIKRLDIVLSHAKYHKQCYTNFFKNRNSKYSKRGRPRSEVIDDQMVHVCDYIDNMDETHFTYQDIQDAFEIDLPGVRMFNSRLIEHYGTNIMLENASGKTTIYSLVNKQKDVHDTRYTEHVGEEIEEMKPLLLHNV